MNPWIANSFLDSCAFDPKYHPENEAANELFRLHQTEDLGILLAHSNQREVEPGDTDGMWGRHLAPKPVP